MTQINSYKDPGFGAYNLILVMAEEEKIPHKIAANARRVIDGTLPSDSIDDDLAIVCQAENIYHLFDVVVQKLIKLIGDPKLRQTLWETLRSDRAAKPTLVIAKEKLDEFVAKAEADGNTTNASEINLLSEEMGIIENAGENLQKGVSAAAHKPFYDYLATMVLPNNKKAIEDEELLASELARIIRIEMIIEPVMDKTLADLPALRTELKQALLVPPGIIRSLAMGTPANQILRMFRCVERVTNYFLGELRKNKPQISNL